MSQARSTALSAVLCVGNVSLSTPMLIYEKRVQYSLSTAVLLQLYTAMSKRVGPQPLDNPWPLIYSETRENLSPCA